MTSVSLPEQVIECLDALAERTGRSRGVYLRIVTYETDCSKVTMPEAQLLPRLCRVAPAERTPHPRPTREAPLGSTSKREGTYATNVICRDSGQARRWSGAWWGGVLPGLFWCCCARVSGR
ncbi:ribbon-helix-helix protein, CopG family [Micrococcus luteus]|uniref:ribbon-helix-helix protein, CopG family n=1 Tax=Micrococcus luteus TaxID=1270 RepID=UPI003529D3C7